MQVIYGDNEKGKSTLMSFLKFMFYSKKSSGAGNNKFYIRQKYEPWNGGQMKGSLEFLHDGCDYKLQKEFGATPAKDKVMLQNLTIGESVKLGKSEEIGEKFFEMDANSFERSSYIGNIGYADFEISKGNKDTLADKIIKSLCETGEEDDTKSKVLKRLQDASTDLKPVRGSNGKIFNIQKIIENLKSEKAQAEQNEQLYAESKNKLDDVKKLVNRRNYLGDAIKKASECKRALQIKKIIALMDEKDDIIRQLQEINLTPDEAQKVAKELKNSQLKSKVLKDELEKAKKPMQLNRQIAVSQAEYDNLNMLLKNKDEFSQKYIEAKKLSECSVDTLCGADNIYNYDAKISSILENYKNCKDEQSKMILERDQLELDLKNNSGAKSKNIVPLFIMIMTTLCAVFMFAALPVITATCVGVLLLGCGALVSFKFFKNKNLLSENLKAELETLNQNTANCHNCAENFKNEFENYINVSMAKFKKEIDNINEKIERELTAKNCKSIEEYRECVSQTNRVNSINKSYMDSKDEFLNIIFQKFGTRDFAKAEILAQKIIECSSNFEIVNDKIQSNARILNVTDLNREDLIKLINCCSNSENFTAEQLTKIESEYKHLNELSLDEQYLKLAGNLTLYKGENSNDLQKKIDDFSLRLAKAEDYFNSLQIATSAVEEAADEVRKNFNPQLDVKASDIFRKLTGGKYGKVHVQKDYEMIAESNSIDHMVKNLSSGTIDQAYLSLRLAISELISNGRNVPIILDDALMQYDDNRANLALAFLKDYAKNDKQVILFTCHKNVVEMANKNNIKTLAI